MLLLLALACAPEDPTVLAAVTDGGTWTVRVDEGTYAVGLAPVTLHVEGDTVEGLIVTAASSMEGMDHGAETAPFTDQGGGAYEGRLGFSMAGVWQIHGTVDDGVVPAEGFTLQVVAE